MRTVFLLAVLLICAAAESNAQHSAQRAIIADNEAVNVTALKRLRSKFRKQERAADSRVKAYCAKRGTTPVTMDSLGNSSVMIDVLNGVPVYLDSQSEPSAVSIAPSDNTKTISTDRVKVGGDLGLNLTGAGINILNFEHHRPCQEYTNTFGHRITVGTEVELTLGKHGQQTISLMIADGVDDARVGGMAERATAQVHSDTRLSELADQALKGEYLANHSAVRDCGWRSKDPIVCEDQPASEWRGESGSEDVNFGRYSSGMRDLDAILYNNRYMLYVQSAGNDRDDDNAHPDSDYYWRPEDQCSSIVRERDGGTDGFDCIPAGATAKNVLTVGAVEMRVDGYDGPQSVVASTFSSWGPTDDGRIKPDIVSAGGGYRTMHSCDVVEGFGGTSAAAPSVTGSVALLQELAANKRCGGLMKAATVKALLIHTADESGPHPGPDYMFGWGLMNTANAALMVKDIASGVDMVSIKLLEGKQRILPIVITAEQPYKVTTCWSDAPGEEGSTELNDRSAKLINDVDIRLVNNADPKEVYFPYVLDADKPEQAAQRGDNSVDNVEQIYVDHLKPGSYSLIVSHKGALYNNRTWLSVVKDPVIKDGTCGVDPTFGENGPIKQDKHVRISFATCNSIRVYYWGALDSSVPNRVWRISRDGQLVHSEPVSSTNLDLGRFDDIPGEYTVFIRALTPNANPISNVLSYRVR